jgi:hypothetical protein
MTRTNIAKIAKIEKPVAAEFFNCAIILFGQSSIFGNYGNRGNSFGCFSWQNTLAVVYSAFDGGSDDSSGQRQPGELDRSLEFDREHSGGCRAVVP